ncbi:hypothetical protein COB55_01940 [Candidatus Wolfebacteria bacterium]|nr:MAG: hypothetical protein COB55_01940 [Candidatus Wolfebacteria bacterium]
MSTKHITNIPKTPLRFVLMASKPYWVFAVFAMLAMSIGTAMLAFIPYIFKRVVDLVSTLPVIDPSEIWFWTIAYVVVSFVGGLMMRMSGFIGLNWAAGARAYGRRVLSEYVTQHSHNFFSNNFAGSIGSKISNASNGARTMVTEIMWGWVSFAITFIISFVLVFTTNVIVGYIFLAWVIVIVPINIFLIRKRLPLGMDVQQKETKLRGHTIDMLTNVSAMNDYARRNFELKRMNRLIDSRHIAGLKNWRFSEIILTTNTLLEGVFVAGMVFSTIYFWTQGIVTAGDVVLILTLVVSIRKTLAFIGQRFNEFAETIIEVKEGLEVILHDHEITDQADARLLKVTNGDIIFKDVTFKYEGKNVFSGLNLHIKQGERVGLVGHSGAGKSTLFKLLLRQYDITKGHVLIDDQDTSLVTQESLRNSIAVVPQDPLLFHRSLEENIRYGNLSATKDDMVTAAKKAQAHGFIEELPKKYKTLVGERGVKLSGGERQRVAIARAFLKEAKILLLDEATSALDSESELHIQAALEKLIQGKTVIAIAHRLSTLRSMDRIIVLNKGRIVQDGSHEDLLKEKGIYADLWAHQAGGFVKE